MYCLNTMPTTDAGILKQFLPKQYNKTNTIITPQQNNIIYITKLIISLRICTYTCVPNCNLIDSRKLKHT